MRVGDGAAHEGRMQHARQFKVGDKLATAGQQPPILAPQQRAPYIGSAAFAHGRLPLTPLAPHPSLPRLRRRGKRAHHLCRGGDRLDDVYIAGAAAQHRGDAFADLVLGRGRVCREKIECSDQHAGGAEATLQCVMLVKCLLQRVQLLALGKTLDGQQLGAVGLHGEHQAGARGLAVEQDRAGAADPVFAADMSAGQPEIFAQKSTSNLRGSHRPS